MQTHPLTGLRARELRSFGVTLGAVVAALFGLWLPWLRAQPMPAWPFAVGALLAGLGAVAPWTLGAVYRGWMKFGEVMGRITTPILLGLLFFLVVTPIARVRAWRRRDPLARHRDPAAASYRILSRTPNPKDLEKPF